MVCKFGLDLVICLRKKQPVCYSGQPVWYFTKVPVSRDLWPWPWAHLGCRLTWGPSCASLVLIRSFAFEKKQPVCYVGRRYDIWHRTNWLQYFAPASRRSNNNIKNNTLANIIRIKEHTVNKIPIIMSVSKFEIMRSGAKTVTIISLPG